MLWKGVDTGVVDWSLTVIIMIILVAPHTVMVTCKHCQVSASSVLSHFSFYLIFKVFMMAVWTEVTTGFDTEEETVNFGTRAVVDNSNGIFETLTLATIQPQGEVCSYIVYLLYFLVVNVWK
jgi:hypothetical protein